MTTITQQDKIYAAGHRGLVDAAIVRRLEQGGYSNIIGRTHAELDLLDHAPVREFFATEKPACVIDAISLMPTNLYGPGDNFDLEEGIAGTYTRYRTRS